MDDVSVIAFSLPVGGASCPALVRFDKRDFCTANIEKLY